MKRLLRGARWLPMVGLLAMTACAGTGLGTLGEVLSDSRGLPGRGVGGRWTGELRGEVQQVDARRREIRVRTREGRWTSVEYDSRTRVTRGRDRYRASALERGDLVRVRVREESRGRLYASRIEVERIGRDRDRRDDDGWRARLQSFEGRVVRIDPRRGWFEVEPQRGGRYRVVVGDDTGRDARERVRGMRSGSWVRVEGVRVSDGRVELYRFR